MIFALKKKNCVSKTRYFVSQTRDFAALGDDALPVIAFVNKLSTALAKEGIQTSYCIGGMHGNLPLARALNQTVMRTVCKLQYKCRNFRMLLLKMQKEWRMAPEK